MPVKVYCEHSALNPTIRQMQRDRRIELLHFPYDPDSRSRHLPNLAAPSAAQFRDLNNLSISELPGTWDDYSGSACYERILEIIGPQHRRDALHVDSAFKSGCLAFVTVDSDVLTAREALESLLGLRFFHGVKEIEKFRDFVTGLSSGEDV